MDSLTEGIRRGDRRALSRFLTRIESAPDRAEEGLAALYPHTGHARVAGITGPPGAGKSTLVSALAVELRRRDRTVAILAIDPSSSITGGALLGDRIRMQALSQDPGVFLRSVGTRGALGGLSATTLDALVALDAFGFDHILVETVGSGQDEVDVRQAVHSVVLVQPPGAGDAIQSLKAGALEVAGCYVVNKADLPGAELVAAELSTMLSLAPAGEWPPPVLLTTATTNQGIIELADTLERHHQFLAEHGRLAAWQRAHTAFHIATLARRRLLAQFTCRLQAHGLLDHLVAGVQTGDMTPYAAAEEAFAAVSEAQGVET